MSRHCIIEGSTAISWETGSIVPPMSILSEPFFNFEQIVLERMTGCAIKSPLPLMLQALMNFNSEDHNIIPSALISFDIKSWQHGVNFWLSTCGVSPNRKIEIQSQCSRIGWAKWNQLNSKENYWEAAVFELNQHQQLPSLEFQPPSYLPTYSVISLPPCLLLVFVWAVSSTTSSTKHFTAVLILKGVWCSVVFCQSVMWQCPHVHLRTYVQYQCLALCLGTLVPRQKSNFMTSCNSMVNKNVIMLSTQLHANLDHRS